MADSDHTTSLSSVSRRRLLTGAASVPLLRLTGPETADPILPLWQEWQHRQARADKLCRQWQVLETHLMRTVGVPHVRIPAPDSPDGIWAESDAEIDRMLVANGGSDEVRAALHTDLAARQERWNAEAAAVGFDAIKQLETEAWDEQTDVSDAIFVTPAISLAGIEAKLAVLVELCETGAGDPEFPCPQLRSTLADVRRLRRETCASRR